VNFEILRSDTYNKSQIFFLLEVHTHTYLSVLPRPHVGFNAGRDASLKNLFNFSDQVDLWAGNGYREDSLEGREGERKRERIE
jgi:hypothetical protein